MADIVIGRLTALDVIACDQRLRRFLREHESELPGEILGVLHARIRAARAEGRELMSAVAAEHHSIVHEAFDAPALEAIDRDPFEIEFIMSKHGGETRPDTFGPLLLLRLGRAAELEIDAPDILRLPVHERRAALVKGRIEPEAALGRQIGAHLDVRDQELVLESLAGEFDAEPSPQGRVHAVTGDHPIGAQSVSPVRRRHDELHPGRIGRDLRHLVSPRNSMPGNAAGPERQEVLDMVLLEVDEGRALVSPFRQQIELVKKVRSLEDLAAPPGDAFLNHGIADPEPIPDLERALGVADAARAFPDAIGIVEKHDHNVPLREIDGEREPDRPRADHDYAVMGGLAPLLIRRAAISELKEVFSLRHEAQLSLGACTKGAEARLRSELQRREIAVAVSNLHPCSFSHISRSRSAVQITG